MYLPFLLAFLVALAILTGKEKLATWAWPILIVVLMVTFVHHVTKPLQLSF
jgi:steroid 5-alpha reductase family enzyme